MGRRKYWYGLIAGSFVGFFAGTGITSYYAQKEIDGLNARLRYQESINKARESGKPNVIETLPESKDAGLPRTFGVPFESELEKEAQK